MMKIRYGNYSSYSGYEMELTEGRYETPISEQEKLYSLCYDIEDEPSMLNGFFKHKLAKKYCIGLPFSELTNAYFVQTKAVYKGYEFLVYPYYADLSCLELVTNDEEIAKKMNFVKLFDTHSRPYYAIEVKKNEIEKLWEERGQSEFNLPFPDGLELYKEIEISKL